MEKTVETYIKYKLLKAFGQLGIEGTEGVIKRCYPPQTQKVLLKLYRDLITKR